MTNQTIEIMMKTVTTDFLKVKIVSGQTGNIKTVIEWNLEIPIFSECKKRPVSFYEMTMIFLNLMKFRFRSI
mgnify:CR=1 FL=1